MIATSTEETGTAPATATGEKPKATKKGRVAPQGAYVAKKKGKAAKKASPAKKAPKGAKKAAGPRDGSKTSKVLEFEPQLSRREQAPVAGDDARFSVDQNRIIKPKGCDTGGDLGNLRVGVRPGVPGPRDQLVDHPQLDLLRHREKVQLVRDSYCHVLQARL
jgi:hypothetical protein